MAVVNLIKKKGVNPLTKQVIFFPQWTRRSTDTAMELAEQMDGSTYSQGEITGMLIDFPKRILRSLMNGNAAKIPGLGTFKLKVQGKAKANIDDVTTAGCRAQVVFDVDPVLAARLADCQFTFVQKPTAEGEQDVSGDEGENGGSIKIQASAIFLASTRFNSIGFLSKYDSSKSTNFNDSIILLSLLSFLYPNSSIA